MNALSHPCPLFVYALVRNVPGMTTLMSILLLGHALAHLVGFVVPWQLMAVPDMPYRTTVLGGALDLGRIGIRLYGLLWLAAAAAVTGVATALLLQEPAWYPMALITLPASLVLCLLGWPNARLGIIANVVFLAWAVAGMRLGWLPQAT